MKDDIQEKHINRILSGGFFATYQDKDIFYNLCITAKDKLYINHIKEKTYDKAKNKKILTQEEFIKINKIDIENFDKLIKESKERLDRLKEEYFDSFYIITKKEKIKEYINQEKSILYKISIDKYEALNGATCEQYVEKIVIQKKIALFVKNNDLDYSIMSDEDWQLLKALYILNFLDEEKIRGIAKSSSWRAYWNSGNKNPLSIFNIRCIAEASDEQLSLIQWSSFYDNIYEAYDHPDEDIINDDIAMDVWYKRKINQIRKEKKIDKISPKNKSKEVYIITSKDKAKEVYDLNNTVTRNLLKKRDEIINQNGKATENELVKKLGKAHAGLFVGESKNGNKQAR